MYNSGFFLKGLSDSEHEICKFDVIRKLPENIIGFATTSAAHFEVSQITIWKKKHYIFFTVLQRYYSYGNEQEPVYTQV
jgi:hypothetical protein